MRQIIFSFLSLACVFIQTTLRADELPQAPDSQYSSNIPFKAFTGQVTKNKVRMRLQPTLEGKIVRQLNKADLLLVIGETEDFYIVKAPKDIKGYIFRTYVLDEVIEGKHVNIRLEPDLDAPIIGQFNSGDKVQGTISPINSKWLEISPPENTQFFVSKEYIEKIGDAHLKANIERRKDEVDSLLNSTYQLSQDEMQKTFPEILIDPVLKGFSRVINDYEDFPLQVEKAKELLALIQEAYLEKKLQYLEAKTQAITRAALGEEDSSGPQYLVPTNPKLAVWVPAETAIYQKWAAQNNNAPIEFFYETQKKEATLLTGIVEPYIRSVRNKPGDYILVSKTTRLPSAYLYSTQLDLQEKVGQEVTLLAIQRPNNNFAHPAYFVFTAE